MARLSTGDDRDEFDKLRVRHEVTQATKLLIEVAVVLRNLLDGGHWPLDVIHGARGDVRPEIGVGVLKEGTRAEVSLGFRSACNKLIHAKRIAFGMATLPDRMNYLDGSVELHGDWQGNASISARSLGE